MFVDDLGELRCDFCALVAAHFAGTGGNLMRLAFHVHVLSDKLPHFRIVGRAFAVAARRAWHHSWTTIAAARTHSATGSHSAAGHSTTGHFSLRAGAARLWTKSAEAAPFAPKAAAIWTTKAATTTERAGFFAWIGFGTRTCFAGRRRTILARPWIASPRWRCIG